MNREIEFKSYIKRDDGTVYSVIYTPFEDNTPMVDAILSKSEKILAYGLQFTGAFDCLGDKIYDGDIIEFDAREWGNDVSNKHVVSWDDYNCGWSFGGGGQTGDMGWRTVIGSIYSTPELLKP